MYRYLPLPIFLIAEISASAAEPIDLSAFKVANLTVESDAEQSLPVMSGGICITTIDEWERHRQQIRREWMTIIGEWPERGEAKPLTFIDSTGCDGYTRYSVECEWLPEMVTRGYLLVPDNIESPTGAVITVFYEPETAVGFGTSPYRDFALQLTRRGLITLSLGSTETTNDKTYGLYYPAIENAEIEPLSAMALAAGNALESLALDPRVDGSRIGIAGHSYGGKWALFASCLSDRFACAAWSDPGIEFDETKGSYINYWEPWYLGYYPPPWTDTWNQSGPTERRGAYRRLIEEGHTLPELIALMAPRPLLISGGYSDGPERIPALKAIGSIYSLYGADDRLLFTSRTDHAPNEESNEVIFQFFLNNLHR